MIHCLFLFWSKFGLFLGKAQETTVILLRWRLDGTIVWFCGFLILVDYVRFERPLICLSIFGLIKDTDC